MFFVSICLGLSVRFSIIFFMFIGLFGISHIATQWPTLCCLLLEAIFNVARLLLSFIASSSYFTV